MGLSLAPKLIESHLVAGKPVVGEEVGIQIERILLADTNGNMSAAVRGHGGIGF